MSPTPTGTAPSSSVRRAIVASLIGISLEWYDFFIYGAAAALVFNELFIPSFEPLVGTLLAFATYAVGFVARPLWAGWCSGTTGTSSAESPLFRAVETSGSKVRAPIVDVLRLYPKRVLLVGASGVGSTWPSTRSCLFITTYVVTYLELPSNYALNAVLIAAPAANGALSLLGPSLPTPHARCS